MKARKLIGLLLAFCFIIVECVSPVLAEEMPAAESMPFDESIPSDESMPSNESEPSDESMPSNESEPSDESTPSNESGSSMEGTDASEAGEAPEIETASALEEPEESGTLEEEVTNVEDTVLESISFALSATISQEQEKLPKYTEEELMYLSCIIYCEAGNQSTTGKVAVANVVMNRVSSDVFDHVTTIKEAIYDCERWGRQFSPVYVRSNGKWTTKGSAYEKALTMYKTGSYAKEWQKEQMEDCIKAARSALEGKVVVEDFLYFNMGISSGKARCQKTGAPYKVIGCHIFY